MYNEYFGFREKPFNVTPDPKFYYTNPIYQEAYASLLYGIRERKGFIVVIGEVGTGKTTLLRRLMREPDENVSFVFFYNTTLSFEELVTFACDELDLPVKGAGRLPKICVCYPIWKPLPKSFSRSCWSVKPSSTRSLTNRSSGRSSSASPFSAGSIA